MRIEKDFIGEKEIATDAYYGIHSLRASENFGSATFFPEVWYRATGFVKAAVYQTLEKFYEAAENEFGIRDISFPGDQFNFRIPEKSVLGLLNKAALEVADGFYFENFIVPGISGGAGTSINMNVNEIVTNAALNFAGLDSGSYEEIDPLEDANVFQSTNDVIPTSLKCAILFKVDELEPLINRMRTLVESFETEFSDVMRMGYTEYQAAVPTTLGRLFSTYSSAFSRDWWRISKCRERIKVVNLGGSAIGTGLTVPRYLVFEGVRTLNRLTGLSLARAENLSDATVNMDSIVEVSAVVKSYAVNLEKMADDLRLLSADVVGDCAVLTLAPVQAGSSIMPGKVNPVISEFIISCCAKIYANDSLISSLAARGSLELNPYLPAIGCAILENLELLISMTSSLYEKLLGGLKLKPDYSYKKMLMLPSVSTVLVPYIGYNKASETAHYMKNNKCSIKEAVKALGFYDDEDLNEVLKPGRLISLGFSIK
jgi:aspartate ammonia-lyase